MKTPALSALFALVSTTVLAGAGSPAAPIPQDALTLAQCLQLAEESHPSLAAARAAIEAAGRGVDEARAPWWPQVDASAGYHRWQRRAFLPEGIFPAGRSAPELIGPLDDWNAGVVARATLYDFGERRAGVDAATARREGVRADAETTRADLRLAVQRAFYGFAAAQDLGAIAARSLERAEAGRKLADARRAAGAVPQADVLRAQAEVAQARLEVISAESRVRSAAGRLNTLLARPAETPVEIAADAGASAEAMDVGAATEHALQARPEIVSARRAVEAASAAARGARAAGAPRLRADGSYGVRDTEWLPESREWQAGVSVDVPVFDGGARRSRAARAGAEQRRAEAAFASVELRVREEVWSAAAELDRARAALAAGESLLREREEALRVTRARYEAGGALVTDLLTTQTALASAEAGLAAARWDEALAAAAFARAAALDRAPR